MNLFKNYLQWKCLYFWYKHISRTRMYWRRDELQIPMTMRLLSNPVFDIIYQATEMITMYDSLVTEENTLQSFKGQQVCVLDIILVNYYYFLFVNPFELFRKKVLI